MQKENAKKQHSKDPKDLAYYLTMFTLEGHQTWRCHLGQDAGSFDRQSANDNWPKITAKNVIRIDRITGQIQPL